MCGVIGLTSEHHRTDLGLVTAELLRTLEYRGYDSTGAAIQGEGESIVLRKAVGAPSLMVEELGINRLEGSIMCGQVRWATFGSVDDLNAQPHEVECRTRLYGAHNGNVTNCDDLKAWLTSEGHHVVSDNDGEMVVHTIEHYFSEELRARRTDDVQPDDEARRGAMRAAIVTAGAKLKGSYAAVVVDPVSRTVWAIKEGSSLYFGFGHDPDGGDFAVASSDLSSVLKMTRVLVPVSEGELIEYTPSSWQIYAIRDRGPIAAGQHLERQPVRSRLQAKDAALLPQFASYMEQEIAAQEETCRRIATLFRGGSDSARAVGAILAGFPAHDRESLDSAMQMLRDEYDDEKIAVRFRELLDLPAWSRLLEPIRESLAKEIAGIASGRFAESLTSLESGLLTDLLSIASNETERLSVKLLDAVIEREEVVQFHAAAEEFLEACTRSIDSGGRIFIVCCGSSHHAALAGAVFFNELARTQVIPVLPGEFRGRFAKSLRGEDVIVAVSQSGETKDLIDVMNQVIATGLPIRRIALVNNVSSTLGLEKCETVLPLRCGPEISVPATKSYMNQMAMFYALAIRLGKVRLEAMEVSEEARTLLARELEDRDRNLEALPRLIGETLSSTEMEIDEAARLLYLRPSMHILATRLLAIAKEGALKIREVVLNHTEGVEGSEFKHGPNTILGFNTIFGIDGVMRAVEMIRERFDSAARKESEILQPAMAATEHPTSSAESTSEGGTDGSMDPMPVDEILRELYEDYPLIFVTGPEEADVQLTVSQLNTHKIRGATCVVVAEDHEALRQAASRPPAGNPRYRSVCITLPPTGDNLMVLFTATVVLQRLALRMSMLKREYLDALGVKNHGVHPDVPKNVSKSITVD
jgi:glutamine---fructose-6-phosphate transaminase (isomerizing)